ncbi:MAG: hypothetical protein ACE5FJ_07795 [Gemmatimonadales bacterium]
MGIVDKTREILAARPLAHRPAIPARYWFYIAAAYLVPVVVQIGFPEDPTLTDELVWLITLVPAFLLSLTYGLPGSFAALVFGTVLFLVVQFTVGQLGVADDWRITVPTYIAYSTLAISVGWLSEQLHEHYKRSMSRERLTAIGELVVMLNHELNNALTPLINETDMLLADPSVSVDERHASLMAIKESAKRIAVVLVRLARLEDTPVKTYLGGTTMLDLDEAQLRPGWNPNPTPGVPSED